MLFLENDKKTDTFVFLIQNLLQSQFYFDLIRFLQRLYRRLSNVRYETLKLTYILDK